GRTALHCAAKTGHIKSMQALLQGGVNPNIKDAMGGPPIHRAVDENELAAVDFVLQHKANCNYTDNWGRNILHAAALTARTQILRLLLVTCKDLNVNAQGNDGETPLHDAVRGDHYWTAKTLLEFGARTDVLNKSGRTPGLGWAAALGNLEACKRLVKAGAPIQLKSTNGMTPIQVAKNYGH
ncbi:ankyrin, partial [Lophium mytilinum]